jgi:hypothetical protein
MVAPVTANLRRKRLSKSLNYPVSQNVLLSRVLRPEGYAVSLATYMSTLV